MDSLVAKIMNVKVDFGVEMQLKIHPIIQVKTQAVQMGAQVQIKVLIQQDLLEVEDYNWMTRIQHNLISVYQI